MMFLLIGLDMHALTIDLAIRILSFNLAHNMSCYLINRFPHISLEGNVAEELCFVHISYQGFQLSL